MTDLAAVLSFLLAVFGLALTGLAWAAVLNGREPARVGVGVTLFVAGLMCLWGAVLRA